jgi:hypothetical protein
VVNRSFNEVEYEQNSPNRISPIFGYLCAILLSISIFAIIYTTQITFSSAFAKTNDAIIGMKFTDPPENWSGVVIRDCTEPFEECMFAWAIIDPIFNPSYRASIRAFNLTSSIPGYEACNCKNISDFVVWDNIRMSRTNFAGPGNETEVNNNHPAWQMEIKEKGNYQFLVWTINNNIGYVFSYSYTNMGNNEPDKYLTDFKQILRTVMFLPH